MFHAEPVFLVNDEQAQVLELDVLLQEPVGPHYQIDSTLLQSLDGPRLLLLRTEPAQHLDPHRIVAKPLRKGLEVLLGEDGRRYEKGDLFVVDHGLEGGADGDLGLSETDVAADNAVHGFVLHQVVQDLTNDPLLPVRLLVFEALLHLPEKLVVGRKGVPLSELALRVELDQFLRDVLDVLLDPALRVPPVAGAELVYLGFRLLSTDILLDKLQRIDRHVKPVFILILDEKEVLFAPVDLQFLNAFVYADAVFQVNYIIAYREVPEGAEELVGPVPFLFHGPLSSVRQCPPR